MLSALNHPTAYRLQDSVFIQNGYGRWLVKVLEIQAVTVEQTKAVLHLQDETLELKDVPDDFMQRLPGHVFVQTAENCMVNTQKLVELHKGAVLLESGTFPLARAYRQGVLDRIIHL